MKKDKKRNEDIYAKEQGSQNGDDAITYGILHVHSRGFGFVSPDNPNQYPEDLFIPKHFKGNAIDGDYVKVAIYKKKRANKGAEGRVLSVVKRKKKELVGIVWITNKKYYILYIHSLGDSKRAIVKQKKGVNYHIGSRLLLKVIDWGNEKNLSLIHI